MPEIPKVHVVLTVHLAKVPKMHVFCILHAFRQVAIKICKLQTFWPAVNPFLLMNFSSTWLCRSTTTRSEKRSASTRASSFWSARSIEPHARCAPSCGISIRITEIAGDFNILENTGVLIAIDKQANSPIVSEKHFYLNSGESHFIGMKKTVMQNLPSPYGDCVDTETYESHFQADMNSLNMTYSKENCLVLCKQYHVKSCCNCVARSFGRKFSTRAVVRETPSSPVHTRPSMSLTWTKHALKSVLPSASESATTLLSLQ